MTEHQEIWCQPGNMPKRQFVVFFDDPDQGIAVFDDEDEARTFWEKANMAWSCYLLGTLPRDRTAPAVPPLRGWPIGTDDQVEALARECEWDNRKYMTPADYSIWCERMRKFARLASSSDTSGAYPGGNHDT